MTSFSLENYDDTCYGIGVCIWIRVCVWTCHPKCLLNTVQRNSIRKVRRFVKRIAGEERMKEMDEKRREKINLSEVSIEMTFLVVERDEIVSRVT